MKEVGYVNTLSAIIICGLSAVGLGTVIWAVASIFVFPLVSDESVKLYMLVSAKEANRLHQTLKALKWLEDIDLVRFDALVLDAGLKPEERHEAAYTSGYYGVEFITPEQLMDMIK